ncbi:MAG: Multi-sensor signal transduction histidine kinase [Verrucomicrobiales bacterium]|nr:Multi-sensor signal transduction histidine kinase [Verrucomicrobiales bacterium]
MQKPIKILLIEDSSFDARLLQVLLSDQPSTPFDWTCVERLADGLKRVRSEPFDIVLSDLSLPDSHGWETFQWLRSQAPHVPIIVLSGTDDETLAIRAVREGAQDYLVKGKFDAHILSRAIRYSIERHRVEMALQESEKHYKFLLESITDYTYTVQLENGKPMRSTHGVGCVAVTGYGPHEYDKDPELWLEMVHEADRKAVLDQADKVLQGHIPAPLEHRLLHKNGQVRWVRNTVVPILEKDGRLVGYDGLISDITERKSAEEKLVTSEAFYHSLVENLPQNILRKDLNERFTFCNQNFCTMLGVTLEQILGKTDFDFFPDDLAAKYQRDDQYVMRSGRTFETIEEHQSPHGEKLYVNVVKTPIRDAKGDIIGIQGIFWDITERKRWEERLQKANQDLANSEAALRKSHEDLKSAQLQLIQAEKMESIGTLAAGVAHEVKNPLAILLMGINYLNRKLTPEDGSSQTVLKEMRDAIDRANTITRGLLDFSASRQLAMKAEPLNTLLEETLRLVRHELLKCQITLTTEFGEDLPSVPVDRTQIQQVFVNVFMNAIHAMPEGGTLTVRTYAKNMTDTTFVEGSKSASHIWMGETAVVAEVEDTGTGIAQEHLAKIFDPFFTTKPTGKGTGLGLPVSKKIIELHGGVMDIRNKRDSRGVRVTIMLRAQPK